MVLPIGIGDIGRETPEMTTTVIAKNPNPTWVPGPMVRKSWLEQKGIGLPAVVPPGPDNPLGKFAMRLGYGNRDYLIHGTNKDFGVGLRVSAGCIRLSRTSTARSRSQIVGRGSRRSNSAKARSRTASGTPALRPASSAVSVRCQNSSSPRQRAQPVSRCARTRAAAAEFTRFSA